MILFFKNDISLALDFRPFLENMRMSSSLSKILETWINVFKSNYQIIKNRKYYEKSTRMRQKKYRWLSVAITEWYDLFGIKLIFYDPSYMLKLSAIVFTLRSSVLVSFNNLLLIDATDRSKISSVKAINFRIKPIPPFIFRKHSL